MVLLVSIAVVLPVAVLLMVVLCVAMLLLTAVRLRLPPSLCAGRVVVYLVVELAVVLVVGVVVWCWSGFY